MQIQLKSKKTLHRVQLSQHHARTACVALLNYFLSLQTISAGYTKEKKKNEQKKSRNITVIIGAEFYGRGEQPSTF